MEKQPLLVPQSQSDQFVDLLGNVVQSKLGTQFSTLSDKAILKEIAADNIYIEPFEPRNLGTASYDVTLGRFYFRENREAKGLSFYNPYSAREVARVWGGQDDFHTAIVVKDWRRHNNNFVLENIFDDDQIIVLDPGETILAHTNEFIGGCDMTIVTMMKARSSTGRNFIEVCKCAGWGDVGYHNRWTMEITNNSTKYQIPLVVGRRIGQMVFFKTEGVEGKIYTDTGKYHTTTDKAKMLKEWHPSQMLPRMYKDREVTESKNRGKKIVFNPAL